MDDPFNDDTMFDAAEELLVEGMLRVEQVMRELRARGYDIDPDDRGDCDEFVDVMVDGRDYWHLVDHLMTPAHVLAGRVFTHVVTDADVESGGLEVELDLALLSVDESRVFETNHGRFDDEVGRRNALRPASGTLPWLAGTTVAVRWIDTGRLEIDAVDANAIADRRALTDAVRPAFDACVSPRGTTLQLELIAAMIINDPDAFRTPQRPLTEMLAGAGLERRGDEVAPAGFDWDALLEARHREHVAWLADTFDLSEESAERFDRLETLVLRITDPDVFDDGAAGTAGQADEALDLLGDDKALDEAFFESMTRRAAEAPRLDDRRAFVTAALTTGRRLPASVCMLQAALAEEDGDPAAHESAVHAALRADPDFAPALEDAAWIAAERGDAGRALTLLHRVGESVDDSEIEMLSWYASPGPMTTGRNDPCRCGSGKKHKQCCGPHRGHDLSDRFAWRVVRAGEFSQRPVNRQGLREMAARAFGPSPDAKPRDVAETLVLVGAAHPTTVWLQLAEGGLFERYVAERGSLMPADERELLESWPPLRHRLLRFDEPADGPAPAPGDVGDVPVVDVVTGEGFDLPAFQSPSRPRGGEMALALVVTDGTQPRFAGLPIPVAPERVEETKALLAAEPRDVAAIARLLLSDLIRDLASGIEERLAYYDDYEDEADDVGDYYLDRLEMVLELLDDSVSEEKVIGRDPWVDGALLTEDELFELMAAAHPEYADAIDSDTEVEVAGEAMSPRLHVAMHTVAARQVLELAPPAAWRTLLRLLDEGYDLHEVMHMLASLVSHHMYAAIREGVVYNEAEHVAALDALPGDWEHERHRLAAQARSRHRRADQHRPRR